MKKSTFFAIYALLIALAEVETSFVDPVYGLFFHAVILISLLALSALKHMDNPLSILLLSLSLAPLIRIISLCLPLAYFPRYAWYLLAGLAVFLATLALMKVLNLGFRDVGVTFNKPLVQLAVGFSGAPLGVIEFYILKPEPLASGLNLLNLFLLALALIFFTGFVEELVFRGVIQRSAVACLGSKAGILGVGLIFALLHIGWLSLFDFIFVFVIGLIFGYVAFKTDSIIGVSLSHGLTNVLLFLILPSTKLINLL
jgi:membrane protease YdiL (CAAX protease family)